MASGGKREGAGRKPVKDKKQVVANYIETSIINALGGLESTKEKLYSFVKTEAGRQKNKNTCTSDDSCTCPLCNLHIVSNSSLVMATYRFPNGNVATFGYDDQQIPELQGVYSDELRDKIKQRSDSRTSWNGF